MDYDSRAPPLLSDTRRGQLNFPIWTEATTLSEDIMFKPKSTIAIPSPEKPEEQFTFAPMSTSPVHPSMADLVYRLDGQGHAVLTHRSSGCICTRVHGVRQLFPVGSTRPAECEHPGGIVLTILDVVRLGIAPDTASQEPSSRGVDERELLEAENAVWLTAEEARQCAQNRARRIRQDDLWIAFAKKQRSRRAHTVIVPSEVPPVPSPELSGRNRFHNAQESGRPKPRSANCAPISGALKAWHDQILWVNTSLLRPARSA